MTFPVPGPTVADLLRAFAEVTHEALKRAETAEAELAAEHQLSANLGLDNRALQDRLREAGETIARLGRTQDDSNTLIKRLRDPDQPPVPFERAHTGPPGRCWCGVVHGHDQAIRLTAGRLVRDGAAARDRIEKNT